MTATEKQKELTLSAKVGNHREVLMALTERLDAAEVQIRKLEREVYGSPQPTDEQDTSMPAVY